MNRGQILTTAAVVVGLAAGLGTGVLVERSDLFGRAPVNNVQGVHEDLVDETTEALPSDIEMKQGSYVKLRALEFPHHARILRDDAMTERAVARCDVDETYWRNLAAVGLTPRLEHVLSAP